MISHAEKIRVEDPPPATPLNRAQPISSRPLVRTEYPARACHLVTPTLVPIKRDDACYCSLDPVFPSLSSSPSAILLLVKHPREIKRTERSKAVAGASFSRYHRQALQNNGPLAVYPTFLPSTYQSPKPNRPRLNPLQLPGGAPLTVSLETGDVNHHNTLRSLEMKQNEHLRYHQAWSGYYYGDIAERESYR
ncbi:unnamed protein product [Protopolystoma xenopodis]|uniref:Uncharacterized protein n=1 Tax=Protopolystoma xenopodis TaxID=117903 RepID=A0A448WV38_9PLAT|nr:unnamed protein product [Protopolystoma xenopodis]